MRLAESAAAAAAAASWKLVNGNLSGNFTRPLSDGGDTGALRKSERRVSKSGSAQLADGREDARVGSGEQQLLTRHRRSAPANMPAIKKERPDGDDMALAAFNRSEYLAPLNATAIPVVTPHPPPYDHIFAHHRAYLGLHDSALHHQHLHHHTDDLMLERFSSIPDFQPFFDNGEPCIEVECGENKALLYINKLCQGSKGPSIKYRGEWLTPNEFQFVSGRETAKDWKRSIRHKGKSVHCPHGSWVKRDTVHSLTEHLFFFYTAFFNSGYKLGSGFWCSVFVAKGLQQSVRKGVRWERAHILSVPTEALTRSLAGDHTHQSGAVWSVNCAGIEVQSGDTLIIPR